MSKLGAFFGPHAGTLRIFVGPFAVGSGRFKSFSDFEAEFAGKYEFLGQSGTVNLEITLTDQNPDNKSGPCDITLNDKPDKKATYKVAGKTLTIKTKLNDEPISVHVVQGGTQVDNISGHNIWFGP